MAKETGMEEVIANEKAIRAALHGPIGDKELRLDATAILTGRFPSVGTRLDALKEISKRLKLTVDV